MKYFIAGGVVCAEGGPFLFLGLIFVAMSSRLSGFGIFFGMSIAFIIIGAVSVCVGLNLLSRAIRERNLYLQGESSQIPPRFNTEKRPCRSCGKLVPNLNFCLECGAMLD
ncbi:MAG: hypothetical protein RBG13Loki_1367 [Promethearchaeota archaeon CR_4]|nr:MAG: hypothetical protein RBG13Loki_1367 [Candidatus Lokiarchaeota archaeon CR_4]